MGLIGKKGEFDDLCQELESWIIEYNSPSFDFPLYMVWLTDSDDNDTDKFIVDRTDKIFASNNPVQLLKNISEAKLEIPNLEKTKDWLQRSSEMDVFPFCSYDMLLIKQGVAEKKITNEWLYETTNFINLYQDFGCQVQDENILALSNTNELVQVWDFYYDNIFWPHFGSKSEINKHEVSKFEVDFEKLSDGIFELIQGFEKNIVIK